MQHFGLKIDKETVILEQMCADQYVLCMRRYSIHFLFLTEPTYPP